jgi:YfiH family protein
LNLAQHVGDAAGDVSANCARLRAELQLPDEPVWLRQVHGCAVVRAARRAATASTEAPPVADAAVTREAGLPLAIMVADCLPVLLCSASGHVIAAAHAGWRGLAAGVLEATVQAMDLAGEPACAWFGPCIRQPQFEVGAEVRTAFMQAAAAGDAAVTAAAFSDNARGRWQCDLARLAELRLRRLGITSIDDCGICTHADAARCFSHRRDGQTGRMAALLWLQP